MIFSPSQEMPATLRRPPRRISSYNVKARSFLATNVPPETGERRRTRTTCGDGAVLPAHITFGGRVPCRAWGITVDLPAVVALFLPLSLPSFAGCAVVYTAGLTLRICPNRHEDIIPESCRILIIKISSVHANTIIRIATTSDCHQRFGNDIYKVPVGSRPTTAYISRFLIVVSGFLAVPIVHDGLRRSIIASHILEVLTLCLNIAVLAVTLVRGVLSHCSKLLRPSHGRNTMNAAVFVVCPKPLFLRTRICRLGLDGDTKAQHHPCGEQAPKCTF